MRPILPPDSLTRWDDMRRPMSGSREGRGHDGRMGRREVVVANPRKRVPDNVPGDFFVDSTCIDCDTCRQIAPAVFGQAAETSFVKAQPDAGTDRRVALQALLA